MGILLPPVPQATVTTLTLHHRNRSLDSALQRIPEVDVTPSPECETAPDSVIKVSSPSSIIKSRSREREDLASLGSDDSGILCGSDSGSSDAATATTRESSVDHLHSRESLDSSLSQAGDMDCVDAVDGDDTGSVSLDVMESQSKDIQQCINIPEKCLDSVEQQQKQQQHQNQYIVANEKQTFVNSERTSMREPQKINVNSDYTNELRDEKPSCGNNGYHNTLEVAMQSELAGAAMTLCCGATQPDDDTSKKPLEIRRQETAQPKPTESCLLRLFESQIFDMSMAISYLFNSKEPGVQSYLGQLKQCFFCC